ncbi:MAG: ECF transporter S component [Lachnospiraceae bacterium]|nr:ECF transporter S component [Lachnospiraceae bacterium]
MNTNNTGNTFNTSQLVILGLMTAILLLMAYTPLGYLNIGPLAITFNVIPVAIAAITLGPVGGAVTGSVFGLTSFLQCIGIGGTSAMGAILFGINPFLAFIQRFVPRFLDGLLLGYIFRGVRKMTNTSVACLATGFCSAFLNTLFFMTALVLLFGSTEYMQGLIGGRNILVFICGFVGINAVCEMVSSTILTGAVGIALYKAHFVPAPSRSQSAGEKSCAR